MAIGLAALMARERQPLLGLGGYPGGVLALQVQ